jgi:hypothetical protein
MRGRVFVLERSLTAEDIAIGVKTRVAGFVAVTMPYYLRPAAEMVEFPIILTNGFGKKRRSERIFNQLRRFAGRNQAAFDAHMPGRWQNDRPEIIIPLGSQDATPPPSPDTRLKVGMLVRIGRAPHQGAVGEITALPDSPQPIDNGLHTLVARVKLETGQTYAIPLPNLELLR